MKQDTNLCPDTKAREWTTFTGPVFILGTGRSGTRLLRGLLNEHPRISIPLVETACLPYWVARWKSFGDLSDRKRFKKFYRAAIRHSYFTYMRGMDGVIGEEEWYRLCKSYTPSGVFEALVRHDAGVQYGSDKIWGDKSPSYIGHLPLLKNLYPQARFVHIVRDVRDYCLSINKAHGKNMIRAAQRWIDSVTRLRRDAENLQVDLAEVRFEDLLDEPERQLKRVCSFLDIEFIPAMVRLSRPVENVGDAKHERRIKRDNKGKYARKMRPSLLRRIEHIAGAALRMYGFPVDYSGKAIRVSRATMVLYHFLDGVNLVRHRARGRGLAGALIAELRGFRSSGNRLAGL